MSSLALKDGWEDVVEADRALEETGQVCRWVIVGPKGAPAFGTTARTCRARCGRHPAATADGPRLHLTVGLWRMTKLSRDRTNEARCRSYWTGPRSSNYLSRANEILRIWSKFDCRRTSCKIRRYLLVGYCRISITHVHNCASISEPQSVESGNTFKKCYTIPTYGHPVDVDMF
jgi:hypothetical protein